MEVESKLWRYAAGVQTLPYGGRELGGLEKGGRCRGMEVWRRAPGVGAREVCRDGGRETRCSCGGMEVWRRAVGVATQRYGDMEVWRRAAGVSDVEVWRYGALEA